MGHLVPLGLHTPTFQWAPNPVQLGHQIDDQTDRVIADQIVVKPQVIDPGSVRTNPWLLGVCSKT